MISYTTFAPPEFGAGQAPFRGALPPAPQEEQMRASQLYSFTDLGVVLPRIDDGKEKTIEPLIETPAVQISRCQSSCQCCWNSKSASAKYCGTNRMEIRYACGVAQWSTYSSSTGKETW
ncbi:hypothetical protein ACH5RR_005411 [Cinchona calisaya]|uniref:Uncharacterized protein n=1 Tax=Cinchona calisaya TaxID=153742 RepID=A0ABD3AL18_9GENT